MITMIKLEELQKQLVNLFNESIFDEEKHIYTINGERYKSVSTTVKDYVEPFNSHMFASIKAKGDSKYKEQIIQYWNAKRDEAAYRGKRIHLYAEMYPNLMEPMCKQEQAVKDWFKDNIENGKYEIVARELRVYDKKRKLAGTIDMIIRCTKTGMLSIVDWKSNQKDLFTYYGSKKLMAPFDKLQDCSFNQYVLQLSLYQDILCSASEEIAKIFSPKNSINIVWLDIRKDTALSVFKVSLQRTIKKPTYKQYSLNSIDCSQIWQPQRTNTAW